jgi:PAS domain S-box-containing protein
MKNKHIDSAKAEGNYNGMLNANAEFKILFESVPGLYLVLLSDFTIYAVSDAYTAATMTQREEIVGKKLFEVFPDNPDDKSADGVSNLRYSLNFVLKNKMPHTMALPKYDIRKPDGTFEERYWSPINKPVLNSTNEVIFIIHRAEDVTEFVRLQNIQAEKDTITANLKARSYEMEFEIIKRSKEIQRLNEELEKKVIERTLQLELKNKNISDYKFALDESCIVAVTDQKGIIQFANSNFCKISKYTAEELIGQDHRIVNSGHHSKEFIRELWTTISKGSVWKGELKNKAKDGTIYWVDTTIVPFLNEKGKPYKYLAIRSDITERKQAEERILKMNEELESTIEARTLELKQSLEREKKLNELKSRFVAMASHEFRTPLSAILSSVSLIESYHTDEQKEKRDKHISRIKSSIKNLVDVLNDFLSLDKLEQDKVNVEKETFDLYEFCSDIVEEVSGMAKQGQCIRIIQCGEKKIVQDKKILRHILLNLLSNAIKYSAENKEIYLFIEVNNGMVCVKVQDQGIGIPQEEQENLFGKFYRAKNALNIQGTGLGLNIVKKYVELLAGTIGFTSVQNEGTTFTVEFPANKS